MHAPYREEMNMTLQQTDRSLFLRRALIADAVITGVTGLMMFLGAGMLGALFSMPTALLRYAGLSLIPFAAFVGALATRESISRVAVRAVIVANALWVVDSCLLLVTGWVEPTMPGYVFVIGQAAIVAVFAEVQFIGLRSTVLPAH
jgi:hypothetical protein